MPFIRKKKSKTPVDTRTRAMTAAVTDVVGDEDLSSPVNSVIESLSSLNESQLDILKTTLNVSDYGSLAESLADIRSLMKNKFASTSMVAAYTRVSRLRKNIIKEIDRISDFYLVDVIIDQMVEDALTPEVSSGEVLSVSSENKHINKELKILDERIGFDTLILDILPDVLRYGEYILKPKVSNKGGLEELIDCVEQGTVLAVSKGRKIDGYIELAAGRHGYTLKLKDSSDYAIFTLPGKKIRIDIQKHYGVKDPETCFANIPRFVRVGKGVIYPVINKFKELELMEQLVPATKLQKMTSGTILSIQVPPGYDLDKATRVCRRLEGIINEKIAIDVSQGQMTLENVLGTAGKFKCIPIFGDKGTVNKMDYKSDEPDDLLASIEDLRKVCCSSIGVLYEVIFLSEGMDKGEILRRYARYLRRLKNIQRAIRDGVRRVCQIHLANKGIGAKDDDIVVDFRNKLIEIDNIDKLEFLDTSVNMLSNINDFLNNLTEDEESPLAEKVDMEAFAKFLGQQLNMIGLTGVIKVEDETNEMES